MLACLLPTAGVSVLVGLDQRAERQSRLGDLALQQAALISGDLDTVALGARTLLAATATIPAVQALDPGCGPQLAAVTRDAPEYAFLAVLDLEGRLVCSSTPGPMFAPPPAPPPAWALWAVDARGFAVGAFADPPGAEDEVLPLALPLRGRDGERRGALVAGLDLAWLARHLAGLGAGSLPPGAVVTVADRDGTVIARSSRHRDYVGKRLPSPVLPRIHAEQPGTMRDETADGADQLLAYVPAGRSGASLAVTLAAPEPPPMGDSDRESLRDVALLAASALLATLLCLAAMRRLFHRASAQLLDAARRWHAGDLGVRVDAPAADAEFGEVAAAWNAMADSLERREAELREQAQTLEARVAERTLELSDSNNRLQVEIAERQQTEASLVQAQKLQTMGQLAGGIAHDFNNLLATILGSLELIGRGLTAEQARQAAMIARASDAVRRGAQLSSRLLAFSRRKALAFRATDINQLVGDLGVLLATSTLGHRIGIEMQLDPGLWPAMVEPSQIEAAILNLALNARDAMPAGGVLTIATRTETLAAPSGPEDLKAGDYVAITLRDTGTGMSEEVARRAFDPFFTTKGAAGSGLGLAQVLGVCREAGGTVRIESAPNLGTAVTLLLPRARVAPVALQGDTRSRSGRRWKVLLVDDDEAVRAVTADMLAEIGCVVRQAADGEAALAMLQGPDAPELLVADYAMPGLNGLALVAAAREAGFAGPVVLATGYAEAAEPAAGEQAPDAVLRKPFTGDELARVLSRLAGKRRARPLHPVEA